MTEMQSGEVEQVIRSIIFQAATLWSQRHGANVLPEAQEALLERAFAHSGEIAKQLQSGDATPASILQAAMRQLDTASSLSQIGQRARRPPSDISATNVLRSMKFKCHWIPWC